MNHSTQTNDSFSIKISGVRIERGYTRKGVLTLHRYQEEVYRSQNELIAVDAPTGSGKTLAILLAAEKYLDEGENALILYPTKSLIKDQYESLKKLTNQLGLNTEIIAVDADRLHKHAMENGFRTHGEALYHMLSVSTPKIILTNPDIIYCILRLLYKRGKILLTKLFNIGFFGIDEAHLYWGVSLQILYTFINLFKHRKKLLTTATHDPSLKRLLANHEQLSLIKARLSENGALVRRSVDLRITTYKAKGILYEEKEAIRLAEEILKSLDETEDKGRPRTVCIVNSLVFSEKLAQILRERESDISIINSLTPPEYRRTDAKIVIGTNAIEVGIDFNTQTLIFEATDSASFIQRFGRVARKQPGKALCITPYNNFIKLQTSLSQYSQLSYGQLIETVTQAFPRNPSYADIFETYYGVIAQLGITYALTRSFQRKNEGVVRTLIQLLNLSESISPLAISQLKKLKSLFKNSQKLRDAIIEDIYLNRLFKVLGYKNKDAVVKYLRKLLLIVKSFDKMGVRGIYSSLPAYIKREGNENYEALTSVSIRDLEKLAFSYVETQEEFEEETGHKPSPDIELPIIVIHGVSQRRNKIYIKPYNAIPGRIFILKKDQMQVDSGEQRLNEEIARLLDGLPAYLATGYPTDWRFTTLRADIKGIKQWIIVGPDSLIEAWSREKS